MMTTYALIEQNTGYLWGVTEADDPIAACRAIDEDVGCYGRRYVEERIQGTSRTGYQVLDVTGIMSADEELDGQDHATIERACTGHHVAQIATYDADES